jgi:hypothetical protein
MNDGRRAYAKLVRALEGARQAFARRSVEDAFTLVGDAHDWAKETGNPWTAELDDLAESLGRAVAIFRDAEEAFDALFPDDEGSGDPE